MNPRGNLTRAFSLQTRQESPVGRQERMSTARTAPWPRACRAATRPRVRGPISASARVMRPANRCGGTWQRHRRASVRRACIDRRRTVRGDGWPAAARQPEKATYRAATGAPRAVNIAAAVHRLTIRNNVFIEKGMISGDRAGILSPMLLYAVEPTCACPSCPSLCLFDPCDG